MRTLGCHLPQLKVSMVQGDEQLLYLTAEKLRDSQAVKDAVRMLHQLDQISAVVIDEAHLIYEWREKCVPESPPACTWCIPSLPPSCR